MIQISIQWRLLEPLCGLPHCTMRLKLSGKSTPHLAFQRHELKSGSPAQMTSSYTLVDSPTSGIKLLKGARRIKAGSRKAIICVYFSNSLLGPL